jgi:hypothetical protein
VSLQAKSTKLSFICFRYAFYPSNLKNNIPIVVGLTSTIPPSTRHLSSLIRGSSLVPIDSFLWHVALKLVDAASPTSFLQNQDGLVDFIRDLWSEVVEQARLTWETGFLVPRVGVSRERVWGLEGNIGLGDKMCVDLGSGVIHQKLQLLQISCIQKVCLCIF